MFAYAAIALFGAGAVLLTSHGNAKPGFGGGGFKPWAFAHHHHFAHPHHFAFAHFAHRHRFARNFDFGFPGFYDYGTPYAYVEPQIIEVPQENSDVTGAIDPRRVSVWRGYGPNGAACGVQDVTVPASQGGETTVRIIRC
ncbi:MAG TPA: hypothetical protein VKT73_06040 [Xanthobacteraceae bacterium]|nr:hypothetical protein [Xanthobacteraceae bacterium]